MKGEKDEAGYDPRDPPAWKTNLNRQLAEVEVIKSIYGGEGEFELSTNEAVTLEALARLDGNDTIPDAFYISFMVNLSSTEIGGRHVSVGFSMPRGYPEEQAVSVTVTCGGRVSRSEHEAINMGAREAAHKFIGQEAVLQVLQSVQEITLMTSDAVISKSSDQDDRLRSMVCGSLSIKRVLIWFHHIKSLQKRKSILEWGKELSLGGYCKPGFPGIIVIEGEKHNVDTYVRQLQNLRWQAMCIRGEEEEEIPCGKEIDDIRHFPNGVKELDEHGMSELGRSCREANLEHLFLSALKIRR